MKASVIILLALLVGTVNSVGASPGWTIDKPLRFQLAYIPDGHIETNAAQPVKSMELSLDYLPDIDNIVLSDIKLLGFKLPERTNPERFKLYLKLYDFPHKLSAEKLCRQILDAYHLSDMPEAGQLVDFVSSNESVAVKFGVIDDKDKVYTPTSPFPPFTTGAGDGFASAFEKNILFYSLYVNPDTPAEAKTEDELAKESVNGVMAFHKELIAHYNKTLKVVSGAEPDKYYYFRDETTRTTIKVLANPFVLNNWRNLPMPADPKHQFLTGLLLIFRTQDSDTPLAKETVFEVASVLRLK